MARPKGVKKTRLSTTILPETYNWLEEKAGIGNMGEKIDELVKWWKNGNRYVDQKTLSDIEKTEREIQELNRVVEGKETELSILQGEHEKMIEEQKKIAEQETLTPRSTLEETWPQMYAILSKLEYPYGKPGGVEISGRSLVLLRSSKQKMRTLTMQTGKSTFEVDQFILEKLKEMGVWYGDN